MKLSFLQLGGRSSSEGEARPRYVRREAVWVGCLALVSLVATDVGWGATRYVTPEGSHLPPFVSWGTGATNIQAAIDASVAGDTVLVTNGVYDTGGVVAQVSLANRIAITNAITVRSVNGAAHTYIVGRGPRGAYDAVRCAYVGEDARLEGFTLTNGHTLVTGGLDESERTGGGVWCEPSGVVSDCTLVGNSAWVGGATSQGLILNCLISNNVAYAGGGTYEGTVRHCTIRGNTAEGLGGGTSAGLVQYCTISENVAGGGGGTSGGIVQHCTITGNSAESGGGTSFSLVQNCLVTGNRAESLGGGTFGGTVENSTLVGNRSFGFAGGTADATIQNCIVYYNTASLDSQNISSDGGSVDHTCTDPDPGGVGNITNAPALAGRLNPHLLTNSPCMDAGQNQDWMVTAVDIDGDVRISNGTVDIGCDELYAGGLTGVLQVAIFADTLLTAVGVPIQFEAGIGGRPAGLRWSWGDGETTSTAFRDGHGFARPGDYDVVLEAWNLDGSTTATLTVHVVTGFTNYVSELGSHLAPYTTWSTAATNVQAAISANIPGGVVLVTNGVYDTGGVVMSGELMSRVAVTNRVTVRSVHGPEHTSIAGQGPLGDTAVRCAYVGDGSRLEGFTLTGGHSRSGYGLERPDDFSGGGAWCEGTAVISNCVVTGNVASLFGGGVFGGTVEASTLSGNEAGDSYGGSGGGAYQSMIRDCIVSGNRCDGEGGGVASCTVWDSSISGNEASSGGGAAQSTVIGCVVSGNAAVSEVGGLGGGTWQGVALNCHITGNTAALAGGGTGEGTIGNCTIVGNTAGYEGGGASGGTIENCIVYYNAARRDANHSGGILSYTCTTPDPGGVGIITDDPGFAGMNNPHLILASPCVNAGLNRLRMLLERDIDGEARLLNGQVDMGCDEVSVFGLTGPLEVTPVIGHTQASVGFPVPLTAGIQGLVGGYQWQFGDGTTETNILRTSHAYAHPGDYELVLMAWNLSGSVAVTTTVHIVESHTNYVSHAGSHMAPYDSWSTAATNIQAAISAHSVAGGVVQVADGTYDTGEVVVLGVLTNRIALTNGVTVRSVNGPDVTRIVGSGESTNVEIRCAYVGDHCRLEGFTLTRGTARGNPFSAFERAAGGGAYGEPSAVVTHCVFSENHAGSGGGMYQGTALGCTFFENVGANGGAANEATLLNCTATNNSAGAGGATYGGVTRNSLLAGNRAEFNGGATFGGVIENCTIIGNRARTGGGSHDGLIRNCIVYYNTDDTGNANYSQSLVEYSCTTPHPGGVGNLTNHPGIAGLMNPGIVQNSPCIDAGLNRAWMMSAVDLDGEVRIGDGTVDMGCDEVYSGGLTGSLAVIIHTGGTLASVGFPVEFEAEIRGRVAGYQWRFGDGATRSDEVRTRHIYPIPGDYEVALAAWNLDGGVAATVTVQVVSGTTNYVSTSGSHVFPYGSWATAATNIQAAVAVHAVPGGVVVVTNGFYDTGGAAVYGSLTNRIALTNAVTVRSVHGPDHTFLVGRGPAGDGAVRCAYVGDYARLEGFTLTNGHTRSTGVFIEEQSGGGAWCEPSGQVIGCRFVGNHAFAYGGGTFDGIIENSFLHDNSAGVAGGGAARGIVRACVITGNRAQAFAGGGGTHGGRIVNCVISGNAAGLGNGGGASEGSLESCVISGNRATYGGGGGHASTLRNCLVTGNQGGSWGGGGTSHGTAENCTIVGNAASGSGGGTFHTTVRTSIVWGNSADSGSANCLGDDIAFTCTIPDPGGVGNLVMNPLFVDAGASNFHLSVLSPCINAGTNQGWMAGMTDLDGESRIRGGIVDMGCYEAAWVSLDTDGDGMDDDWEYGYFIGLTNLSYHADWDQDGFRDGFEFRAGTDPTDPGSYLGIRSLTRDPAGGGVIIQWSSVSNLSYTVYGSTHLDQGLDSVLDQHLSATPPANTYTDVVGGVGARFYGIEVE